MLWINQHPAHKHSSQKALILFPEVPAPFLKDSAQQSSSHRQIFFGFQGEEIF